jgi:hypothetical protein
MKPTFHASVPARSRDAQRPLNHRTPKSPVTDWSYQASAPAMRGGSSFGRDGRASFTPGFRKLTETLFSAENRRESRLEGIVFGTIAALMAWPFALAVQAAVQLIK